MRICCSVGSADRTDERCVAGFALRAAVLFFSPALLFLGAPEVRRATAFTTFDSGAAAGVVDSPALWFGFRLILVCRGTV